MVEASMVEAPMVEAAMVEALMVEAPMVVAAMLEESKPLFPPTRNRHSAERFIVGVGDE
jgi:hypothetical protein